MTISGRIVDIHQRRIFPGDVKIEGSRIKSIAERKDAGDLYIIPGLIDAHIHIESSMLTPASFAVAAVSRGTTGSVSDPHEIANIMGREGVDFMIEDGRKTPFKFYFGAPSCVPATDFETAGARLGPAEIRELLEMEEIKYLAEMMNYPGVIYDDKEVLEKIALAKSLKKPVDGHAPGLSGDALRKYIGAGIETDHECSTLEEAQEKISLGMKVIIREGSAGRNLHALKDLYRTHPSVIMLGSDDIHPEMLMKRHLDKLISGLIREGYSPFDVIASATLNPVMHYGLESGLLRPGDFADLAVVDDLREMNVLETWINGQKVFDRGKVQFSARPGPAVNRFSCSEICTEEILVKNCGAPFRLISAFDGELITKEVIHEAVQGKMVESNTTADVLKIVVKDRYHDSAPAVAFIRGFGLKSGAFAASVAHDSHNIIAIGVSDQDIADAVNEIVRLKGGMAVVNNGKTHSMQLSVAGIMSDRPCEEVAAEYQFLSGLVRDLGCKMTSPFMTLSFMALLVIPELKLSDRGLFNTSNFSFVPLFAE
ncbi:MAG TPA: adenine deaminase [Bacteroidales bacterium]|nr:adenine deaminase [Bacteroidales bacterium]HQH23169.1 adenine deaminase [Bacteroidales bacterium]HQJ80973.1 adenine deaminase [Bacteroidales bacterium]